MEKRYTKSQIIDIIDAAIREEMQNKNRYIALNGYSHRDTLAAFDNRIAALSYLYGKF